MVRYFGGTEELQYTLRSDQVVNEQFDDETVIIDLETGIYYSISPSGTAILSGLLSGSSSEDIMEQAGFGETIDKNAVVKFLAQLVDNNLITTAPEGHYQSVGNAQLDLTKFSDMPQLEIFEDLADLVWADPIHDVDEDAGWPQMKSD